MNCCSVKAYDTAVSSLSNQCQQSVSILSSLASCLQQYWSGVGQYSFVPAANMTKAFRASPAGQRQAAALAAPCH